jgi:hypothetical protein
MNKLVIAFALVATAAAALPANAQTQRAQSTIQAGNQCFKPTDSARGYGYWTKCDDVYAFALRARVGRISNPEVAAQIENGGGTEGGGGGDGGGGGGGR